MPKNDTVADLLEKCAAAKQSGGDFPTVWHRILKGHPLVSGMPVQRLVAEEARLEVPLITGQRLVYSTEGYEIA
jgi:hypothetical protein